MNARPAAREPRKVHKLQSFSDATGNSASLRRKSTRLDAQAATKSQRNSEDEKPRIIVLSFKADARRIELDSRHLATIIACWSDDCKRNVTRERI